MIEKFTHYFPYRDQHRPLHIYLPDDYYLSERSYPVMYMMDGHNLFYHRDATYGRSWALKHYMDQSDRQMIIVGVECDHDRRLDEYCPCDVAGGGIGGEDINGYAESFLTWLVSDLKPMIDHKYRTQPFRESTGIGGSSMGGLVSFYALLAFNDYFSKAAILSPSLGLCADYLANLLADQDLNPDSRAFFSYGKRELARYPDGQALAQAFCQALEDQGLAATYYVQSNGWHNENTWRRQNPIYMSYLWDD
ncbi:carbohydrate esterase [Aerococcus urinaehominis]|uniref:Carbohydrate esterase n=1 Tax=Aerococcus urinaehominis TaxID=128944 RepID=A0A109RGG1_9LACT|nr:alpha/beta hydrolase-fold protein [Aerococcus urinaehominis]AMB98631.1 carbohydrate esterase [Aerococcus urinaehominis]SDL96015.1 Predicted hydrolase of the alpha/beta superfamily [Aerococcus urinaehominis]